MFLGMLCYFLASSLYHVQNMYIQSRQVFFVTNAIRQVEKCAQDISLHLSNMLANSKFNNSLHYFTMGPMEFVHMLHT